MTKPFGSTRRPPSVGRRLVFTLYAEALQLRYSLCRNNLRSFVPLLGTSVVVSRQVTDNLKEANIRYVYCSVKILSVYIFVQRYLPPGTRQPWAVGYRTCRDGISETQEATSIRARRPSPRLRAKKREPRTNYQAPLVERGFFMFSPSMAEDFETCSTDTAAQPQVSEEAASRPSQCRPVLE